MENLILFILSNAGISFIVTQSKIFEWLRELSKVNTWTRDLLKCPLCTAFWTAIAPYFVFISNHSFFYAFMFCCIGSITSYLIFKVLKKLN